MKQLTKTDIQKTILDIMVEFDKICRENGFTYALAGGSCLGAVRHKGFIPWDDDIDVVLPRPDYDRFLNYCKNSEKSFDVWNLDTDNNCCFTWTRLCDKNTVYGRIDSNYGCFIDVFPVDGVGNDKELFKKNIKYIKFLKGIINYNFGKDIGFIKLFKRQNTYKAKFCFTFFRIFNLIIGAKNAEKRISKILNKWKYNDSKYLAVISSLYLSQTIFSKEIYEETIDVEFEEYTFKTFKNYDVYLKAQYGENYMIPPPPDRRNETHGALTFYYKE